MIKNGQKADQDNFNAAFVSRTNDTETKGVVTLDNVTDPLQGAAVVGVQRAINETFDTVGITGVGDANRKAYSSTNYVANGDSHKTAIGKLDAQAKTQSTAAANVSNATGTLPIANGGTGQTTSTAAFNALAPTTTEGDLITRNATTSTRLPIGTTGQVLTTDTTVTGKVKWAAPAPADLTQATGVLSIGKGGTGQTTQTAAFDALSPNTTKGDITVRNATNNVRQPVGSDGYVLTADSTQATGVKWAVAPGGDLATATGVLAISKGGTGQTTAPAAFDALAPTTTKGDLIVRNASTNIRQAIGADAYVLTADSTQASGIKWAPAPGGDLATATGVLPISKGGTGQTTQAAAITALTGTQTNGRYLRSDGTNATLSAIQAADVPTLNQNTTGTAANVTGVVAIANGGTGQTTQNAALNALLPAQSNNAGNYLKTDGTNASWGAIAGITPVIASYASTAGGSLTANAAITRWDTKLRDTNNAFNPATGVFTVPAGAGGQYRIGATIAYSAGNASSLYLMIGGQNRGYLVTIAQNQLIYYGSVSMQLTAGQQLTLAIDSSATMRAATAPAYFNILTIELTSA